ncbi:hypothetical protein QM787_03870 [Rhodococcus ruber]|uniref:Uncharacterized protein n=1 Tax=Rhodococcus ruber TaxID=1830 RepID=A0A098BVJ7_9NOCA|nr:hypothetical protein [Rhodococcus ruber]MCD2127638.1 hypothetical protein [Rhodococcus ruber]MCZ4504294.1 hypothetical protein [Rhodococcus ruber]MCZ4529470.1 hypothetical protein [Rhodococcus ruber]MCZ4620955.1 hypothetical protein [Rhodococcus ruber]MDI9966979.1 hypothetical protein [Rhodococcus ruber]
MTDSRFPALDFDRTTDEFYGNGYEVLRHNVIEPEVPETGEFIAIPVRTIVDGNNGPGFEIGPYSLTETDVVVLHNALISHIRMFPDLFRPAKKDAS